jgi:uncharacterized protein (DUF433 family)
MDYERLITIEPGKPSGKPCVRGLRITVTDVLEYLAAGMTVEQILDHFPGLTEEAIRACLAFTADREWRLCVVPPGWGCSSTGHPDPAGEMHDRNDRGALAVQT